jgi:hypothetical protein
VVRYRAGRDSVGERTGIRRDQSGRRYRDALEFLVERLDVSRMIVDRLLQPCDAIDVFRAGHRLIGHGVEPCFRSRSDSAIIRTSVASSSVSTRLRTSSRSRCVPLSTRGNCAGVGASALFRHSSFDVRGAVRCSPAGAAEVAHRRLRLALVQIRPIDDGRNRGATLLLGELGEGLAGGREAPQSQADESQADKG